MAAQNATMRCKNCVRFPLLSGPLSILILQPSHGHLLALIPRRPPGFKGIDDAITRLGGAAKGDVEVATIFLYNPTWDVLFFQPHVVITGLVIAPRAAPP